MDLTLKLIPEEMRTCFDEQDAKWERRFADLEFARTAHDAVLDEYLSASSPASPRAKRSATPTCPRPEPPRPTLGPLLATTWRRSNGTGIQRLTMST